MPEVTSKNDTKAYLKRKRADYLQAGVKVVCIADPYKQTITVHQSSREPYVYNAGDVWKLE